MVRRLACFVTLFIPLLCSATRADEKRVVYETEVDAEVARVWKAFTTDKGLRSWMAPVVEFELKLGGKMKANYNPKGKIGDETTIENTVLAYDPQRMLALKATKFPKGFPFKEAAGSVWSVFYFTSLPSNRTRITVVGNGYSDSEQSKKMRSFFATANKYSLDKLKQSLKKQPAGK